MIGLHITFFQYTTFIRQIQVENGIRMIPTKGCSVFNDGESPKDMLIRGRAADRIG